MFTEEGASLFTDVTQCILLQVFSLLLDYHGRLHRLVKADCLIKPADVP